VLFYDRETESFWSQMTGKCVVGPQTGKQLAWIPTTVTTWDEWRKAHPKTTVLAPSLDLERYRATRRSYIRYRKRGEPVRAFLGEKVEVPDTHEAMDVCTIVGRGEDARCYPHSALPEGETKHHGLTIVRKKDTVVVKDAEGKLVPSMQAYWFAFHAFFPEGKVWAPGKEGDR